MRGCHQGWVRSAATLSVGPKGDPIRYIHDKTLGWIGQKFSHRWYYENSGSILFQAWKNTSCLAQYSLCATQSLFFWTHIFFPLLFYWCLAFEESLIHLVSPSSFLSVVLQWWNVTNSARALNVICGQTLWPLSYRYVLQYTKIMIECFRPWN